MKTDLKVWSQIFTKGQLEILWGLMWLINRRVQNKILLYSVKKIKNKISNFFKKRVFYCQKSVKYMKITLDLWILRNGTTFFFCELQCCAITHDIHHSNCRSSYIIITFSVLVGIIRQVVCVFADMVYYGGDHIVVGFRNT